jgi:hypothetical protein
VRAFAARAFEGAVGRLREGRAITCRRAMAAGVLRNMLIFDGVFPFLFGKMEMCYVLSGVEFSRVICVRERKLLWATRTSSNYTQGLFVGTFSLALSVHR